MFTQSLLKSKVLINSNNKQATESLDSVALCVSGIEEVMVKSLIILPEAEQDVTDAYDWYQEQELGLGEEFLRCVDASIQFIQRNPEMYGIAYESYRRVLVRRFPYAIFYEYLEDSVIVYGVFHCSQNPKKWRNRLP